MRLNCTRARSALPGAHAGAVSAVVKATNRAFVKQAVRGKAKQLRDPKPCNLCYRPCRLVDGLWSCPTHGLLDEREQAPR